MDKILKIRLGRDVKDYLSITFGLMCYALGWAAFLLPSAKKLKAEVEKINPSVEAAESIRSAVRKTMEQAQEEDVIVIFGSLSFLGEAELAVSRYKKEEEI